MRYTVLLSGLILLSPASWAQTYPAKTVRILVGFAPGGGTDIMARVLGAKMTESVKQQFIIENRPGANAILFTCSAFGTAIEAAKGAVKVPVLKPNEAMLEEALAAGPTLGVIATFEPSIPSLKKEFEELASSLGIKLKLKTRTVPAAIAALQRGHVSEHESLIAAAAAEMGQCDALVLGQFSMARAAAGIPKTPGRKVLTSPHSAVTRLKQLFAAR